MGAAGAATDRFPVTRVSARAFRFPGSISLGAPRQPVLRKAARQPPSAVTTTNLIWEPGGAAVFKGWTAVLESRENRPVEISLPAQAVREMSALAR